ncbi:MAG: GntR family transcriptional regulator [Fusobacteriaceae bacterium]|jgi:DNA-binding GntR family transcriptional regulator|nr:GntR family transcriptional regulator [Fusobacteriaceae bacterium]
MLNKSLKLHAYDIIKEKIVSCEYKPGTLLSEEVLQKDIATSRTPIRDALGRLDNEGLITILPKKGILVSPLTLESIGSIFEVRLLLEPYALENYGQLIPVEEIQNFLDTFSQPIENLKDEWQALDDAFHAMITGAMPNHFLRQTYDSIQIQNLRFRSITAQHNLQHPMQTLTEHRAILRAWLDKDIEAAAQHLREHIIAAKKRILELLINSPSISL